MSRKLKTDELREFACFLVEVAICIESPNQCSVGLQRKVAEFTSKPGLVDVVAAMAAKVSEINRSERREPVLISDCEPLVVI